MQHPLIVSYYTPGTAYETLAMALAEDVRRLGLAARIEPRPARGSWLENCAQKAGFIQEMHSQEQRPLLWLDADARLNRRLHEFEGIDADFAVVRRRGWEFYGGQIYFGGGPAATALLDIWCEYCARYPQIWDQVSLGYAWWDLSLRQDFKTLWLREKIYTRVAKRASMRLWQKLSPQAPILQQHESRRSKARQGVPEHPEFGMDDVPIWWREAVIRQAPFALDDARRRALGLGNGVSAEAQARPQQQSELA